MPTIVRGPCHAAQGEQRGPHSEYRSYVADRFTPADYRTTFASAPPGRLTLPRAGGASGEAQSPLDQKRILIVEDEPLFALTVEVLLGRLGCQVIGPAHSVAEGLRLASEYTVDAGLLDVNLAGKLVYPVADLLATHRIPFIFLTAYEAADLPPDYATTPRLEKPLHPHAVRSALLALLAS